MPFQMDALRISNAEWQPSERPWAIVQYDDRPLDEMSLGFVNRNSYYCKIHHCAYVFLNSGYEHMPPYWSKVRIAWDLLRLKFSDSEAHLFSGVMWLDMDAVILDLERPIDKLGLDPAKSFACAPDPVGLSSSFNAGVWLVRNTPAGHGLMAAWLGQYRPDAWRRADGRWASHSDWAGESYEQGAFVHHVAPAHAAAIQLLPWEVLQGMSPATPGAFALHFFSCGHALGLGLLQVDRHILQILRTKHAQGDAAAVPLRPLLTMKINLAAALLETANRDGDPAAALALYDEGEAVMAAALRLDPECGPCASNIDRIRRNRAIRAQE